MIFLLEKFRWRGFLQPAGSAIAIRSHCSSPGRPALSEGFTAVPDNKRGAYFCRRRRIIGEVISFFSGPRVSPFACRSSFLFSPFFTSDIIRSFSNSSRLSVFGVTLFFYALEISRNFCFNFSPAKHPGVERLF